jgi:1-deoxy-D-xylulose-5-phosphate synthase
MAELLASIRGPRDLKQLSMKDLKRLCEELRTRIAETVSRRGGHLASNLGAVELTVALHYVFDFSADRLVWDVGHQCYAHKLLTGRADRFDTLRQSGGLAGFPSPTESRYDSFATGHAGSAISTALGLAHGDKAAGRDNSVVAVVGDASLVNGYSFEALNNAHVLERQFLLVLNDNSMGISPTQGALAAYLNRVRLHWTYEDMKKLTKNVLDHIPVVGHSMLEMLENLRVGIKTSLWPGDIFDQLGLRYFGPVDGHDLPSLIGVFERLRHVEVPIVLHAITEKGRGFKPAINDPTRFHSPGPFRICDEEEEAAMEGSSERKWTDAFSEALLRIAERDLRIVAISAAMPDGTGLTPFARRFPNRFHDVGICESHAVGLAAGLAKAGWRPFVAIYSTFLQRSFDQIWQEAVYNKLPIVFCIDRAGLVGQDGASHQGFCDLSFLRPLPDMICMAPADEPELASALEFALLSSGPVAIRYPRSVLPAPFGGCPDFKLGKSRILRTGADAAILAYGSMCRPAVQAAEKLAIEGRQVEVINARFAQPIDEDLLGERLRSGKPMLVVEEHSSVGGLCSAVLEFCSRESISAAISGIGLPNKTIPHAGRDEQMKVLGLDVAGIEAKVREMLTPAGTSKLKNRKQ